MGGGCGSCCKGVESGGFRGRALGGVLGVRLLELGVAWSSQANWNEESERLKIKSD